MAAGLSCFSDSYGHTVSREWRVTTDMSLSGNGAEIVSPILSGQAGLDAAADVARAAEAYGCTINASCGFHVHVGFDRENVSALRRLVACFVRYEEGFDSIMPPSRRGTGNRWAASLRQSVSGAYTAEAAERGWARVMAMTTTNDIRRAANNGCRYHKLNLTVLDRQPTVEFRQHSGTINADKIVNWVKLCVAFVDSTQTSRQRPWAAGEGRDEIGYLLLLVKADKPCADFFRARRKELKTEARTDARAAAAEATRRERERTRINAAVELDHNVRRAA